MVLPSWRRASRAAQTMENTGCVPAGVCRLAEPYGGCDVGWVGGLEDVGDALGDPKSSAQRCAAEARWKTVRGGIGAWVVYKSGGPARMMTPPWKEPRLVVQ